MSKYVEFVGQYTAGKTSTYTYIVEQDLLKPYVVMHPHLPAYRRVRWHFAVWVPILAVLQIRQLWFVTWFFLRYAKVVDSSNWHIWYYLVKMVILHPYYERSFTFDLWLKDDMLHLLPRIVFRPGVDPEEAFARYFVQFAKRYDAVVYVGISFSSMQKRITKRQERKPKPDFAARWQSYRHAYGQHQAMKDMLQQQKHAPLLVIDGDGDLVENARTVSDFIRKTVLN